MRCSLCTFMHGPAHLREQARAAKSKAGVVHPGVPEDVALGCAKMLVQLRAILTQSGIDLCAADVVRGAERFPIIVPSLAKFVQDPSPEHAQILLHSFDPGCVGATCSAPDPETPGSASVPGGSWAWEQFKQDHYMQFSGFLERLQCLTNRYREDIRKASAPEGWRIYGRPYKHRPYFVEVSSCAKLDEAFTQELLERAGFQAPVFALVHGRATSKPRLSRGWAPGCQCNTPWHQRSLWERQPWVAYGLPPQGVAQQSHEQFGAAVVVELMAPASGSAVPPSQSSTKRSMEAGSVGCTAHIQDMQKECVTSEPDVSEGRVAPAPGSATSLQTRGMHEEPDLGHSQLLTWTSEDEAAASSEQGDMQYSDIGSDSSEQEGQSSKEDLQEGEEGAALDEEAGDKVESLDVDIVDSGDGCPYTPLRNPVECGETAAKVEPPYCAEPRDVSQNLQDDGCTFAWGDVLGDDSSDDVASEGVYVNESEQ